MFRERLTSLDDVDISDIWPPPDRGVTSLVKAIRSRGHTTLGSCQGGLGEDHHIHRFPWVTVSGLVVEGCPAYKDIRNRLNEFNERGGVKWTIKQIAIQPERLASNRRELEELQASADELAGFLFDR